MVVVLHNYHTKYAIYGKKKQPACVIPILYRWDHRKNT